MGRGHALLFVELELTPSCSAFGTTVNGKALDWIAVGFAVLA